MERGEKKEKVLAFLRRGIQSGKWKDEILPKEEYLAEKLHMARGTVRKAFAQLVAEGLLERRKRGGTRLINSFQEKAVIGAVMRCQDHYYEDVFRLLKEKTEASGRHLQFIDTFGFRIPTFRTHIRQGIASILKAPITNLILDGLCFPSYPMLEKLLRRNPVFFDFFDGEVPPGATGVLIDYYKIGRMGAEYLLNRGCRRPLLFCGPLPPSKRYAPEKFAIHRDKRLLDGFADVLKEAGMDPWLHICMADSGWKTIDRLMFDIFSSPSCRPDGIFCSEDVKVVKLLNIAEECGYDPPHKIGIFDTPWSQGEDGHWFSSIAISPEESAAALLQQVMLPPEKRENIYLKCRLVKR